MLKYRDMQEDDMTRLNKSPEIFVSTDEERDKTEVQAVAVKNSKSVPVSNKKKERSHNKDHRKRDILCAKTHAVYPFEIYCKMKKEKHRDKSPTNLVSSKLVENTENYIEHMELQEVPYSKKGKKLSLESNVNEEVANWNENPKVITESTEKRDENKLNDTSADCSDTMPKKKKKKKNHDMDKKKDGKILEAVNNMQEFSNPAVQEIYPEVYTKKKSKKQKHRAREESDLETDSDMLDKNMHSVDCYEKGSVFAVEGKQDLTDMASPSKSNSEKKRKKRKMATEIISKEKDMIGWNGNPETSMDIREEKEDCGFQDEGNVLTNNKFLHSDKQKYSKKQNLEHASVNMVVGNTSSVQDSFLQENKKNSNNRCRNDGIVPRNMNDNVSKAEEIADVSGCSMQDAVDINEEIPMGEGEDIEELLDDVTFTPDSEEIEKLSETEIEVFNSIPELHVGRFGGGRVPNKRQIQELQDQGIFVRTTFFTPKEDGILLENWKNFSKEYGFNNPKLFFWHKLSSYIDSEKRKKFWQYMGQGLDDRLLCHVRRRSRTILTCTRKRGRSFSKEDDRIICDYVAKYGPLNFSSLCPVLQRDKDSIRHRWKKIDDKRNGLVLGSWTFEEDEALIKAILEMAGVSHVEDVDDKKVDYKVLEKKFNRPVVTIRSHWFSCLKPKTLMKRDSLFPSEYIERILKMIIDMNVEYPQHIKWEPIVEEFKEAGLTCIAIRKRIRFLFDKKVPLHLKKTSWRDKLLYLYHKWLPLHKENLRYAEQRIWKKSIKNSQISDSPDSDKD